MDLMTRLGAIFGSQPGSVMGAPMPTMAQGQFGARDPASLYAMRAPGPMPGQGFQPAGGVGFQPAGGQGFQPQSLLNDSGYPAPALGGPLVGGPEMRQAGQRMAAMARGGDGGRGQGQGESVYAPLPAGVSVGGRAGGPADFAPYMRAFGRR